MRCEDVEAAQNGCVDEGEGSGIGVLGAYKVQLKIMEEKRAFGITNGQGTVCQPPG